MGGEDLSSLLAWLGCMQNLCLPLQPHLAPPLCHPLLQPGRATGSLTLLSCPYLCPETSLPHIYPLRPNQGGQRDISALLACTKPSGSVPSTTSNLTPGVETNTCNPRTREEETGGLEVRWFLLTEEVQGQPEHKTLSGTTKKIKTTGVTSSGEPSTRWSCSGLS